MIYLTEEELIAINELVIKQANGQSIGVQYPQGLDLVVNQPKQVVFGQELYPNVWIKAAFIIQKITKKHIFVDGNKRTALLSGLTFLSINGIELNFATDEGEQLILGVTNSIDSDEIMVTLAEWLKKHAKV
ncbi:type II toxin-antitoxin system death-on-curing family toxin [Lactiplantibacillus plajomi]|uniref:Type II toxin-antitoxin system death-on-curing family toxin n=1 Tax=Lactiplantibacillus plajomi TaxID=1457217 RepID=A0ABV6K626_9LACO|nr:type II toxin-antitoxin system death-on-curing family toxin [Lactiplantibacillus plajomi]